MAVGHIGLCSVTASCGWLSQRVWLGHQPRRKNRIKLRKVSLWDTDHGLFTPFVVGRTNPTAIAPSYGCCVAGFLSPPAGTVYFPSSLRLYPSLFSSYYADKIAGKSYFAIIVVYICGILSVSLSPDYPELKQCSIERWYTYIYHLPGVSEDLTPKERIYWYSYWIGTIYLL